MMRSKMTAQERLNSPSEIIKLLSMMQVALFLSSVFGCWLKSTNSDDTFGAILASYLPFGWAPIALMLAIAGLLLFRRAERRQGSNPDQ